MLPTAPEPSLSSSFFLPTGKELFVLGPKGGPRVHYSLLTTIQQVVEIPAVATKRKEEDIEVEEFKRRFAYAVVKALAIEAYKYNMEDALESLKGLWKDGILQKYVDRVPELKELIKLGKLP